jgi:hypothetical protein
MPDPSPIPPVGIPGHATRAPRATDSDRPRLDRTQPFGVVCGDATVCFEQNGKKYDKDGVEL